MMTVSLLTIAFLTFFIMFYGAKFLFLLIRTALKQDPTDSERRTLGFLGAFLATITAADIIIILWYFSRIYIPLKSS